MCKDLLGRKMVNLGENLEQEILRRRAMAKHKQRLRDIKNSTSKNLSFSCTYSTSEFQKKRRKFMRQEQIYDLNRTNRILLDRLIAISNRKIRPSPVQKAPKKTHRITKLFNSTLTKRIHTQSPNASAEEEKNDGKYSSERAEIGKIYSAGNSKNTTPAHSKTEGLRNRMIAAKFNQRYNHLKHIEQENMKLAQRLYKNKPCISTRKLEQSYKNHLAIKKRMSRYSKSGMRKSFAMSIVTRKLATGYQSRRTRSKNNSAARSRPKTGAMPKRENGLGDTEPKNVEGINIQNELEPTTEIEVEQNDMSHKQEHKDNSHQNNKVKDSPRPEAK